METFINSITPQWLTHALQEAGYLGEGRVVSFDIRPLTITDFQKVRTAKIQFEFVGDGPAILNSVVLKQARGQKEYHFFAKLASQSNMPQIVNCYHKELIDDGASAIFLLEDLSPTHVQTQWPIPPGVEQCLSAAACLGRFHARWWNHSDLPDLLERSRQTTCWLARIQLALDSLPAFFDFMGDRLSIDRKKVFETIAASDNAGWLPEQTNHGQTLLHGDAHFWNFLYDRGEDPEKIKIIDWNSWNVGRATDDLAYMIGLHWYGERKELWEEKMLRHYHQQLTANYVQYTWENLLADYQLSTLLSLFIPVWQWQHGINAAVWWSHLERGFQAFDQWGCRELL